MEKGEITNLGIRYQDLPLYDISCILTPEKDLISSENSVILGETIFSSLKPTNQLASIVDYQVTQCTAAESLVSVEGVISTEGLEYDLITVSSFEVTDFYYFLLTFDLT